jgi:glycosyltransferase involved in cell wall biosynthesis
MFIHGSAGGYGADRQLRVLAEGLDRDRFAPLVVLPEEGELAAPLRKAGIPVHVEPLAVLRRDHLRGRRLVDTIARYRHNVRVLGGLARAHGARIVHSNTSLVLCGQAVAQRAGAAHVISVREIYAQTGGKAADVAWPVLRRSLLRADALACVSQACASQFGGSERAFVLHDAVPRDLVLPERAAARDALGLEHEGFVAAVIGRISDWKGQEVFTRALADGPLAEIGACGILAGDAAPGQEHFEHRLESLRTELRLGERLRLLGFRDDVETVLGAADVLVVPSTYQEPFPNVALEAGAVGLPVVGTTTGGQDEIIRDGVTGRLVPPRDHGALAGVLRELADDPDHARRLGQEAAADIAERFGHERMVARLEECYDRVLPPPAFAPPTNGTRRAQRPEMISVVLPMRNEEARVGRQLSALAHQTYAGRWEVVVVDNGSTDASREVVDAWREHVPELRIVDASEARGLNYARNRGADAARGDLLAFADADDEAVPEWLESLASAAASADLVGGPLDGNALSNGIVARSTPRSGKRRELPMAYGFLPYVPGGNCAVWTSLARRLRWNEAYAFGGSDVEFSWRAHLAGAQFAFAPDAVMRRSPPTTLRELGSKYFGYGRAAPRVYREFRSVGMTRPPLGEAARDWAWLVKGAPRAALSETFRARWMRVAAKRSGRAFGSLEQRVICL